jgi:hypothetical protein
MHHTDNCALPGSTIFLHIISRMAQFSEKVTEQEMGVLILSTTFVQNISHSVILRRIK